MIADLEAARGEVYGGGHAVTVAELQDRWGKSRNVIISLAGDLVEKKKWVRVTVVDYDRGGRMKPLIAWVSTKHYNEWKDNARQ